LKNKSDTIIFLFQTFKYLPTISLASWSVIIMIIGYLYKFGYGNGKRNGNGIANCLKLGTGRVLTSQLASSCRLCKNKMVRFCSTSWQRSRSIYSAGIAASQLRVRTEAEALDRLLVQCAEPFPTGDW